jgi:hypothetical protein
MAASNQAQRPALIVVNTNEQSASVSPGKLAILNLFGIKRLRHKRKILSFFLKTDGCNGLWVRVLKVAHGFAIAIGAAKALGR